MSNIIITCAITGSINTPSMSPYLPITADEITEHALGAAEAGASLLHLHARDPDKGSPSALPRCSTYHRLEIRLGKPFLEGTGDMVFKNTPRDIKPILKQMGEVRGHALV
jgi:uncharacterized protein (DUF849 family)